MQKPRQSRPPLEKLMWHGMMGITLGILFAGLLVHSGALQAKGLIVGPLSLRATLQILLTFAFLFGVGATLTGALFLANEKT
jgi:hypothetical protein